MLEKDKWVEYCQHDVLLLSKLVFKYFEMTRQNTRPVEGKKKLGSYGVWHEKIWTGAQLALQTFLEMYLTTELYPTPPVLMDIVRDSYFGGVTQVFKKEGKDLFYYDINSSYPAVMMGEIPVHCRTGKLNEDFKHPIPYNTEFKFTKQEGVLRLLKVSWSIDDDIGWSTLGVRAADEIVYP